MSSSDGIFNNLRQKLDIMGYTQSMPLTAIPLVAALFEDLVKTTESLRDAKKRIIELLEEKSCWELGVEPYKCDNSRLLAECNQLHQQILKQNEEQEQRISELNGKIRSLQRDKLHLSQQCEQLQEQLNRLQSKSSGNDGAKQQKDSHKAKKPFISTVRSGTQLPPPLPLTAEQSSSLRCTKCNMGYYQRHDGLSQTNVVPKDYEKLENTNKELTEHIGFYKRKIEARDREIGRLNELLAGGRPAAALARDCCYKDVGALKEDIDLLQREKLESLNRLREYQDQMHEAMQRALDLEKTNRELQQQLDELKEAALQVESQANNEIAQREREVAILQDQLKQIKMRNKHLTEVSGKSKERGAGDQLKAIKSVSNADKHRINERLNELTQKENELKSENEHLLKKINKLKSKLVAAQKDLKELESKQDTQLDEEKIRLKSERDFFQKEYLRLLSKSGSEKEVEFLQTQVKTKDDELRVLRSELCLRQSLSQCGVHGSAVSMNNEPPHGVLATSHPSLPSTARSTVQSSVSSDCVQAIVLRAERERDCARGELEKVRCERDTLREKHVHLTQQHSEELRRHQQRCDELNGRLKQLERENRDLHSFRLPSETQIVLLKEEIEELKQRYSQLQQEHNKIHTSYNQLKVLHEQTQRILCECQTKLALAERQLESTDERLTELDSNRESSRNEATQLRSQVAALKQTFVALENEKDKILSQLDAKTERAYQLEYELKACREKRDNLEEQVQELEEQLQKLSTQRRERDTELHETSTESKSLRQQIVALKASRDQAIAENVRLTNDLADSQAEILTLQKRLKDSETEIERLKQQLRQYVQEVKKAEDLLMHKEKEREEMLEHYRSLSQDAVVLEGNNQSLEVEAAEYKRQLCELETEIAAMKEELCSRNRLIAELEDKISTLTARKTRLERELEESLDDQRLLRTDLTARQELCDKLDIEKDKLNAELNELNAIRHKLESDNERLRSELEKVEKNQKLSAETFEELLTKTRRDLEEQIKIDSRLSQELMRLRQQNENLLKELDVERQKREQHAILAHEYHVQNQELRHNLTDDRFRQARSREQSPRFPTHTL